LQAPAFYKACTTIWFPKAITNLALFNIMLFIACRNLAEKQQDSMHHVRALQYKGAAISLTSQSLNNKIEATSDAMIAVVTMLWLDGVSYTYTIMQSDPHLFL
jgi:hypothetical protein